MRVFAIRIEHALDVAVKRLHHSNTGMHQEIPALSGLDQGFRRQSAILQDFARLSAAS
jgi:hypothetical protein